MYCRNCGNKVDEKAYICVNCGVILDNKKKDKRIKSNSSNDSSGIISMIFGLFALGSSLSCLFLDISKVGMYTEVYDRLFYALDFTDVPIMFTILSFVFALIKKNKTCNKIGLALALISAFLIITEFMVVIIY